MRQDWVLLVTLFVVAFDDVSADAKEELDMCLSIYDVSNRTIIKASASVDKGAQYLDSVQLNNRLDCKIACCNHDKCNIAVFQDTQDKSCYLFDCGSMDDFKCVFAVHDNYVAMGMMVDRSELEKAKIHEQAKHEMDLSMMKANDDKTRKTGGESSAEGSSYAERGNEYTAQEKYNQQQQAYNSQDQTYNRQEQTYDRPEQNYKPDQRYNQQQVSYDRKPNPPPSQNYNRPPESPPQNQQPNRPRPREFIDENKNLVQKPPSSVMDKTIAKPKSPFVNKANAPQSHARERGCRLSSEWMCSDGTCIAVYDVCNGIDQCPDSSDEDKSMCTENLQRRRPQPNNLPAPTPAPTQHVEPLFAPKAPVTYSKPSKVLVSSVEKGNSGGISLAGLVLGVGLSLLAMFVAFVSVRLRNAKRRMRKGKLMDTGEGEFLINGMYL